MKNATFLPVNEGGSHEKIYGTYGGGGWMT